MKQRWKWIRYVLINFSTPIVFYPTFRLAGAKPAIFLAIVATLFQWIAHRRAGEKLSPFFLVSSGFTLLFGSMDLVVDSPRFFRLEPAAENFVVGIAFLVSVIADRPILLWLAEALPAKFRPRLAPGNEAYLRGVTIAWVVYLFAKGGLFLWLAFQVDLGRLIILRSVIGGLTLGLMLGGEVVYRKFFRQAV